MPNSIFKTEISARPATMGGSADRTHIDMNFSTATAMTPAELGFHVKAPVDSQFMPGRDVKNLPPRKRGCHY